MAQSEFAFPAKEAPTDDEFLTEETLALYASVDTLGKILKMSFQKDSGNGNGTSKFKKVLEKYGVEVQVPRRLTDYEKK